MSEARTRTTPLIGQASFHRTEAGTCWIVGPGSALLQAVGLILRGWGFRVAYGREFTGLEATHRKLHSLVADADRIPSVFDEIRKLEISGWKGRVVLFATRPETINPNQRRRLGDGVVLRKPFRLAELSRAVGA